MAGGNAGPVEMPHFTDDEALEKTIDLAVASVLAKEAKVGERVVVALLAEMLERQVDWSPTVRRMAYAWLFQVASREESEEAERKRGGRD